MLLVLILTIIPAVFWLTIFLRKDTFDPEPKKLLFFVFILGAISALIAGNIELELQQLLPTNVAIQFQLFFNGNTSFGFSQTYLLFFISTFFVISIIEELAKIAVVRYASFDNPNFNQVVDGAVFGITSGLGFATLENFGYFSRIATKENLTVLLFLFVLRLLGSSLLHAITTGITGYFLGKVKFGAKRLNFWLAFISAVLLHTSFNLFLFSNFFGLIIQIVLLSFLLIFLLRTMSTVEAQYIRKVISIRK